MAEEVKVYAEVPRRCLIAIANARFDKGKLAIESAQGGRFKVPAIWLNQQVREERGYEDDVSRNGNWVKEGVLYRQTANNVFTKIGLPYLHPEEAVLAHLQCREYTLEGCAQDEIDKAIASGLEINPEDLDKNDDLVIPCSDFGSNKYGLFFFGGKGTDSERSNRAKNSGQWLINSPETIEKFVVRLDSKNYSKKIGRDYAYQMWFSSLGYRSELIGGRGWDRSLRCADRMLGVFDSAEGASQNSA